MPQQRRLEAAELLRQILVAVGDLVVSLLVRD
jgi:hypothetical protein